MRHLVFAALVLSATPSLAGPSTVSGSARVLDGDTVVVDGVTVRLKGVDASERRTARGEAARARMIDVGGGPLRCELTGEKTWKREVGTCFLADGTDINRAIIAAGAALACPRYSARYMSFETAGALAAQERAAYCLPRGR